ncbi:MAG: hypothetical protein ACE5JG_06395, partial [Planctomycetota bacterium]
KTLKIVLAASRDAREKKAELRVHAQHAYQRLRQKRYPLVLRIYPGSSRSFFHGWQNEFRTAYEWFDGVRDWPAELAAAEEREDGGKPPPPPKGAPPPPPPKEAPPPPPK